MEGGEVLDDLPCRISCLVGVTALPEIVGNGFGFSCDLAAYRVGDKRRVHR
jgi:hypothetical protein